jgi:hypothetical protein
LPRALKLAFFVETRKALANGGEKSGFNQKAYGTAWCVGWEIGE